MLRGVHAHIVGVPPQVEGQAVFRGVEHLTFDAAELQPFQRQVGPDGAVHPGAGEIPDAVFAFGRITALACQRQVHIQRAEYLEGKARLYLLVDPVVFLVPVGGKARLAEDFRVFRLTLVSGQNHGGQIVAVIPGDGLSRRNVSGKLLRGLPRLPAVIVAEGVAADFLPRHVGNRLQQRGAVKAGGVRLRFADFGKFRVGIQLFIGVARFLLGKITADLLIVFGKQETHSGPGGVDAVLLEQLQQLWDGLSAAQHVILIGFQRAHIQHPPE